ncbi:STN domain-containing protein [Sphingobium yanoikuyae]|uniref:STN domain-containing protein n=1 Tax=Sphingobium yanoikuyae TaxID=13690 RepID=UPI0035C694D6
MKIVEAGKAAVAGFRTVIPATLLATTALGAGIVMPTSAYAQGRSYNVPAGPLAVALNRLGEAADIEIIYDADLTNGIASPGLQGSYGPAEALSRLLVGTGLTC